MSRSTLQKFKCHQANFVVIFCCCLNGCFLSYYHALQSFQGLTFHGCDFHYIVVGLCSKLLMSLFYYIHLGIGKSFCLTWASNPGPSERKSSTQPQY